MSKLSMVAMIALPLTVATYRPAPKMVVRVDGPTSGGVMMRVIATGGVISAGGRIYKAANDTLHLSTPVELTSTDLVVTATFIADDETKRLSASVSIDGSPGPSATGPMVVVVRGLGGPEAMAGPIPDELRRKK